LFEEELVDFVSTKTVSFLECPDTSSLALASSMFGNMMIVPVEPGKMNIIHHGFKCNFPGSFDLIFVRGNLGDSFYFKVLPHEEATSNIPDQSRQATGGDPPRSKLPLPRNHEGSVDR
jgi:hypothetical protein